MIMRICGLERQHFLNLELNFQQRKSYIFSTVHHNKNNEISGMQAEDIIEPEVQMNWVTSVLQKTVEILTTVLELLSNILHIGFLTF